MEETMNTEIDTTVVEPPKVEVSGIPLDHGVPVSALEFQLQSQGQKSDWKPVIEFKDPAGLIPYVQNSRIHPPEQIDRLASSIAAFGFDQPIVVDSQNVIVKGHGRREAAMKLGMKEVPVVVATHLTEEEIVAARIADNKLPEYGMWNFDNLKLDLDILKGKSVDLTLTQFDQTFLDGLSQLNVMRNESDDKRVSPEGREAYDQSPVRELKFFFTAENYEGVLRRLEEARAQFGLEDYSQLLLSLLDFYEARKTQTQPQ